MGIFSDRCEALVNPATGRALTGAALAEAKKIASWPRCGHSVKKSAKFCSVCGAPARGGWVKCPTCGEWVGNDSNFCWNCNTPLHPTDGVAIAGGVWARGEGVFAQRFEANSVKVPDGQDLQVQEGTVAVLMTGGAVEDVLDAGRFNIESKARKLNWFGNPPPRSVVLVEAGEVILPITIEKVPTKPMEGSGLTAGVPVDAYCEVVIRFRGDKEAGKNFIANVLKERQEVAMDDISARLSPRFERVAKDVCAEATLQDLLSNPHVRIDMSKRMTDFAEDELAALGIELVRVSGADFTCLAYNKFLNADAEKAEERLADDLRRAEEERENAQQEFEAKVALGKFRSEQEILREREAIAFEYRMDDAQRQAAWERLQRKLEAEKDEARRARERDEQKHLQEMETWNLDAEARRERMARERQERQRKQAEEDERLRRAKEKADRAYQQEVEDEKRCRAAAEKVRKQNEEDADRIRMWALLEDEMTHQWSREDALRDHEWKTEASKTQHEAEMAAMVRRATAAKAEFDWDMALRQVAHDNQVDQIKTDYALEKALKIQKGEIGVKTLQDDYARNKKLRDAEVDIGVKRMILDGELEEKRKRTSLENELKVQTAKADSEVVVIDATGKAQALTIKTKAETDAAAAEAQQKLNRLMGLLALKREKEKFEQGSREWWIQMRNDLFRQCCEAPDPEMKAMIRAEWEKAAEEVHRRIEIDE